jgi:hypothetical protein
MRASSFIRRKMRSARASKSIAIFFEPGLADGVTVIESVFSVSAISGPLSFLTRKPAVYAGYLFNPTLTLPVL